MDGEGQRHTRPTPLLRYTGNKTKPVQQSEKKMFNKTDNTDRTKTNRTIQGLLWLSDRIFSAVLSWVVNQLAGRAL
jgi:hypothetical protein